MKRVQCNALNIKTTAKQVWLYFIRRTTRPGYAGNTTNLQMLLNNPKFPTFKIHASSNTKKLLPNFPTQKISELKISYPKRILRSSLSRENRGIPPRRYLLGPGQVIDPHLLDAGQVIEPVDNILMLENA